MSETAASAVEVKLADIGVFRNGDAQEAIADPEPAIGPEPSDAIKNFRVGLVTMPFGCCFRPSIQIGLMKAIAKRAGFPVEDHYLNLDLSKQVGFRLCEDILNEAASDFTGDWLFSIAAFGEEASREDYFAAFPDAARFAETLGKSVEFLNDLRERVIPEFVDSCLDKIDWGSYGAVGFTSIFQQNVASLALARRIKERHPHVAIIFGGSTMAGEMGVEYARAFKFIDFVVTGEGDEVFPELLARIADGHDASDILGVVSRCDDGVNYIGAAPPVRDLEHQPIPNYDTYYEVSRRYGLSKDEEYLAVRGTNLALRAMPIEGSRGCWWGEKAHCTFCGFNRDTMNFRSKSPERMLAEIDELSKKYDRDVFWACDSIMEMKYINGLFGPLGEREHKYEFFFFTKSNLTREHVRQVARGGMKLMFPGIESFSTHVLKLMRKGATRLQTVNVLRWATYYHIQLGYFLLHGFPNETVEDYAEELETSRLITHLNPPMGFFRLRIDRFSPNFWDKDLFPVKWQRPVKAYSFVYPPHVNMDEAAYFFEYESAGDVVPEEAHVERRDFVADWRDSWFNGPRGALTYRRAESDIVIDGSRAGVDQAQSYTLLGPDADVYEACSDAPRTPAQVCAALASDCPGLEPDVESVKAACDAFCEYGLMITEGGKYLSLALPAEAEF